MEDIKKMKAITKFRIYRFLTVIVFGFLFFYSLIAIDVMPLWKSVLVPCLISFIGSFYFFSFSIEIRSLKEKYEIFIDFIYCFFYVFM